MASTLEFHHDLRAELLAAADRDGGRAAPRRIWPTVGAVAVALFALGAVLVPRLIQGKAGETGAAAVTITRANDAHVTFPPGKLLFTPTLDHPLPQARRMSLGAARRLFGAPLGLSTVPGMARDDIGPVFANRSRDGDTGRWDLAGVAITYPGVGALVDYSRPGLKRTRADYRDAVRQQARFHLAVITVGDVPALLIPPNSSNVWGSNVIALTFVKRGTQVSIVIPGATRRQIVAVGESIAAGL